ncbi:MAG: T9SS type A sorting domain-containing protein [Candidatus Marinimicrobia bacterium]|nr:T9SS type A sorting domain-containing protein [Candidatus Neomarinimicrobiota bacterium]
MSWGDDYTQTQSFNATLTQYWDDIDDDSDGDKYNDPNDSTSAGANNGFPGIGNGSTYFTGSYNGNGFTIENLYINRTSTNFIGLFGKIDGAVVENVNVTNVNITGKNCVGAIVGGNLTSGTINNCFSSGSVNSIAEYVGGLIGLSNATITNSYSSCSVNANNYVGGLVGSNSVSVNQSYSSGSVTGMQHVGGLVGYNPGTVRNCYSTASVIRSSGSTNTNFGGCVGYNYNGTIDYCYSTGTVTYTGATNPTDKGLVGAEVGTTTYSNNFFDSTASNQSSDAVGAATAKTTTEMKAVATFTATATSGLDSPWDFVSDPNDDVANNDYWDMDLSGTINNGYPYLNWEDGEDVSLPVELTSFIVENGRNGVMLRWTTESEIENLGFILEKRLQVTGNWLPVSDYTTSEALQGHGSTSEAHEYTYTDAVVVPGAIYLYRLADVDYSGNVIWHKTVEITVDAESVTLPVEFGLQKAYPNPFNPSVTLSYGLKEAGQITLQVYDMRGQLVETLVNTFQSSGSYDVVWQPQNLSSGTYLVRLQAGKASNLRKVMYVK